MDRFWIGPEPQPLGQPAGTLELPEAVEKTRGETTVCRSLQEAEGNPFDGLKDTGRKAHFRCGARVGRFQTPLFGSRKKGKGSI